MAGAAQAICYEIVQVTFSAEPAQALDLSQDDVALWEDERGSLFAWRRTTGNDRGLNDSDTVDPLSHDWVDVPEPLLQRGSSK